MFLDPLGLGVCESISLHLRPLNQASVFGMKPYGCSIIFLFNYGVVLLYWNPIHKNMTNNLQRNERMIIYKECLLYQRVYCWGPVNSSGSLKIRHSWHISPWMYLFHKAGDTAVPSPSSPSGRFTGGKEEGGTVCWCAEREISFYTQLQNFGVIINN